MATIKDIAKRLNISSATVSMALNDRSGISPETKKRVLALAEEMDYIKRVPRHTKNSSSMIGFVVYKKHGRVVADTQFFSELIQAIEHSARVLGYGVSIIYCSGEEELEAVIENWRTSPPEAMLLLATEMTDESLLAPIRIPTMLLDCNLQDYESDKVLIDNEDGIRKALKHLYARGHREIGYFKSNYAIRNFEERARAYEEGLCDLGLEIKKENIFLVPPTTEEAFEAVSKMLQSGLHLPSACIADNDIIACGALKAIKKFGLSVPEDVSLIGFDDVPIASLVEPELTSLHVSREALGGIAVKQLIRRIGKPHAPFTKIRIATELKPRCSVRDVEV